MSKNNWWLPEQHDHELGAYVARGMSDYLIADTMGFSHTTVTKNRRRLGIRQPDAAPDKTRTRTPKEPPPPEPKAEAPLLSPPPPEGSIVEVAKRHLEGRWKEASGGYWLDNRPVNLDQFMQAANRVRVIMGYVQMGPDRWRVK
jgi:hypothetical protein